MEPKVVVEYKCALGEGPVWDIEQQSILWIDIHRGHIHEYHPNQKTLHSLNVGQMVGAISLASDQRLVAALSNGFAFVNRNMGTVIPIADPEAHLPGNRFNDGKCDPNGNFWAGTMAFEETEGAGSLYMLNSRSQVIKQLSKLSISNGIAWTPDGEVMYHIDTPALTVVAFTFDKATSTIKDRRVVIRIPPKEGFPDGMTIDTEGKLWIAHWDGWQVARWDPETGEKLASIRMPVARVTCCTFGGPDLTDLYVTSASAGLTSDEMREQPSAGSLFVIKSCGYQGLPPSTFGQ